jgi:hypothetical protein
MSVEGLREDRLNYLSHTDAQLSPGQFVGTMNSDGFLIAFLQAGEGQRGGIDISVDSVKLASTSVHYYPD